MKKLLTMIALLFLSSCSSVDVHYNAVNSYEKSVGTEYLEYVKKDKLLTSDQKQARVDAVGQFRAYLKAWRDSQ